MKWTQHIIQSPALAEFFIPHKKNERADGMGQQPQCAAENDNQKQAHLRREQNRNDDNSQIKSERNDGLFLFSHSCAGAGACALVLLPF
ncbi:MAG: hypothetical protein EHM72_11735 [Calditrichaeota bacterium]|nr:MAG: hypothetical protein EHM72_11735 [Calditrichota bacterium]